eukprot:s3048_g15.t1
MNQASFFFLLLILIWDKVAVKALSSSLFLDPVNTSAELFTFLFDLHDGKRYCTPAFEAEALEGEVPVVSAQIWLGDFGFSSIAILENNSGIPPFSGPSLVESDYKSNEQCKSTMALRDMQAATQSERDRVLQVPRSMAAAQPMPSPAMPPMVPSMHDADVSSYGSADASNGYAEHASRTTWSSPFGTSDCATARCSLVLTGYATSNASSSNDANDAGSSAYIHSCIPAPCGRPRIAADHEDQAIRAPKRYAAATSEGDSQNQSKVDQRSPFCSYATFESSPGIRRRHPGAQPIVSQLAGLYRRCGETLARVRRQLCGAREKSAEPHCCGQENVLVAKEELDRANKQNEIQEIHSEEEESGEMEISSLGASNRVRETMEGLATSLQTLEKEAAAMMESEAHATKRPRKESPKAADAAKPAGGHF